MPSHRNRLITRETDAVVEPTISARSARDTGGRSRVPRLPEPS
jgi:hypothetical protein